MGRRIDARVTISMSTFHPFPRLPFELRARIWEMTVEPRVVELRISRRDHGVRSRKSIRHVFSTTPIPPVLQVCQQARNQGLYQRPFAKVCNARGWQYIWINLDIDMVSVGEDGLELYKHVAPLIQLLRFAVELDEVFYLFERHRLRLFTNLKLVHIIALDGLGFWYGSYFAIDWPCDDENVYLIHGADDTEYFSRGEMIKLDKLNDIVDGA